LMPRATVVYGAAIRISRPAMISSASPIMPVTR